VKGCGDVWSSRLRRRPGRPRIDADLQILIRSALEICRLVPALDDCAARYARAVAPRSLSRLLAGEITSTSATPHSERGAATHCGHGPHNRTWGEERIAAELRLKLGRDGIFAPAVDEALRSMSLPVLKTPARANAHCERFIGTARLECLDWMIPLNERQHPSRRPASSLRAGTSRRVNLCGAHGLDSHTTGRGHVLLDWTSPP
jgi:hypothetical protein